MFFARCFFVLILLIGTTRLMSQAIFIPHSVDIAVDEGEQTQDIIFYQYPYLTVQVDLRDFKKKFPNLIAPDYLTIQPPELQTFQSLSIMMGLLSGEKQDSNALVVWIVGDYFSSEASFFIDKNMDRDYQNDGPPMLIKPGRTPKSVIIVQKGPPQKAHELFIQVPKKAREKLVNPGNSQKLKIGNQLSFGFNLGFGSGNFFYQYDNLEKGFPTWYTVNFSEKSLGLSLSYSFPHFRVGLSGILQNHFYYTSYLNIRYDHPEIRIDPNSGQRIKIDNVQVERNMDIHAKNRLQLGLVTAYRIHLKETMELQPVLGFGKVVYLAGEYVADRTSDEGAFNLPASNYLEGGLLFEVATGAHRAFYLGAFYNRVWWEPEGFFEIVPHENLENRVKSWRGQLGYRIGF